MNARSAAEQKLSRDAWLQRGLEVLRDEGIFGVRVERLARDLGVTKGSFYWHFDNRDDLFESLLEFWVRAYNDPVILHESFGELAPDQGLVALTMMIREQRLDRFELAMRSWADHDDRAAGAVKRVYEQRQAFIRGFFTRLGFRGGEADARTRLMLCYLSWDPGIGATETMTQSKANVRKAIAVLVGKPL